MNRSCLSRPCGRHRLQLQSRRLKLSKGWFCYLGASTHPILVNVKHNSAPTQLQSILEDNNMTARQILGLQEQHSILTTQIEEVASAESLVFASGSFTFAGFASSSALSCLLLKASCGVQQDVAVL